MSIETRINALDAAVRVLAEKGGEAVLDLAHKFHAFIEGGASNSPVTQDPPKKAAGGKKGTATETTAPATTAAVTPAASAPAAQTPAASQPAPSSPSTDAASPAVSGNLMTEAAAAVISLANNYGRELATNILAKYGAQKVSQVKVENLQAVLNEANAAIEAAKAAKANESLV